MTLFRFDNGTCLKFHYTSLLLRVIKRVQDVAQSNNYVRIDTHILRSPSHYLELPSKRNILSGRKFRGEVPFKFLDFAQKTSNNTPTKTIDCTV